MDKKWIVLFRGINVGGNNILPMKALVVLLENIGYSNVKTYIQSGNVVLEAKGSTAQKIEKLIARTVLDQHGFEPRVLVLSVREFEKALGSNPFPDAEADPKSLHLSFLCETPTSANLDAMKEIAAISEEYSLIGNVFYLCAPDGIGRSKLAAKAEKLLGVDATGRNWRTVSKLLELARRSE